MSMWGGAGDAIRDAERDRARLAAVERSGRTRADDLSGVYDLDGNRLGDLVRVDDGPETTEPAVFYAGAFGVVWLPADAVVIRDE